MEHYPPNTRHRNRAGLHLAARAGYTTRCRKNPVELTDSAGLRAVAVPPLPRAAWDTVQEFHR